MPNPICYAQPNMILYNPTHLSNASDMARNNLPILYIIPIPQPPAPMLMPLPWTIDPESGPVGRKIINRRVNHRISLRLMA